MAKDELIGHLIQKIEDPNNTYKVMGKFEGKYCYYIIMHTVEFKLNRLDIFDIDKYQVV